MVVPLPRQVVEVDDRSRSQEKGRPHGEEAPDSEGSGQEEGEEGEERRHGQQNAHRLGLPKPFLHEPVVDVIVVPLKGVLPGEETTDKGEKRVQEGNGEEDQWDHQGDSQNRFLGKLQGEYGEKEPQEKASPVTHVDLRRVDVEGEEPGHGTEEGGENRYVEGGPLKVAQDDQVQGEDQRRSSGQTVEAVDQVEGVGDSHQPESREGKGEPTEGERASPEGKGQEFDPKTTREEGPGHKQLHCQLLFGVQAGQIVHQAQEEDQNESPYEEEVVPGNREILHEDRKVGRGEEKEEEVEGAEKAGEDSQASQSGAGFLGEPPLGEGKVMPPKEADQPPLKDEGDEKG